MSVIQTMGLSKRYKDKWAVDHLELRVEQGDIYGFIGQNGAGKSTTLKLLCGLASPTAGEITMFGRPLRDTVAHRRTGMLIEQPGLYHDLSGRENLRLYAALLGLDGPRRQVDETLRTVGLAPDDKKPVKQYSMGMKQRLGVGRSLCGAALIRCRWRGGGGRDVTPKPGSSLDSGCYEPGWAGRRHAKIFSCPYLDEQMRSLTPKWLGDIIYIENSIT